MPLTPEEVAQVQSAITAGTFHFATQPELALLAPLGLVVRTPAQETAFVATTKTSAISDHDRDAYTNMEAEIKAITGIEKTGANEKASAYFKRAMTETKTKLAAAEANSQGTAEQTQTITDLKAKVAELETTVSGFDAVKAEAVNGVKTQQLYDSVEASIRSSLKKSIDPSIVDLVVQAKMAQFKEKYSLSYDAQGNAVPVTKVADKLVEQRDSNQAPKKLLDLAKDEFKDLLEVAAPPVNGSPAPKPNQQNLPVPAQNNAPRVAPAAADYKRPETATTRIALHSAMVERGFDETTADFNTVFAREGAELPLR